MFGENLCEKIARAKNPFLQWFLASLAETVVLFELVVSNHSVEILGFSVTHILREIKVSES